MNNRKPKRTDEFKEFKTKIFIRTVVMVFCAGIAVLFLYSLVQGKFADSMVNILRLLFHMDYYQALDVYQTIFRDHMDSLFMLAMMLIFFIIFHVYLNWFTKYFQEINKGIDMVIKEEQEEVSLSPELAATEKKINTLKHTLLKRKLDAQSAEQRKNDLIVYLAHDLKTPLASVIGYLNLLHDEKQISEELREKYLSISLNKAERLEDLINEFFEIARFNLSNITLQYTRINLTRLLEQLLYEFKPMLQEKDLTCKLHAGEDIMLRCDADKIQRVFDNLLRNAVIYSFAGTDVAIDVAEQDKRVMITFSNSGAAIPKEQLERIFEQFYRLDAARSSSGGGAGLGLAIAKQIIELHQGTITAESKEERTSFTVCLPVS